MNQKKQIQKIQKIRFYLKMHAVFTAILFGVYFFSAVFYNPNFFLADVRAKLSAIADTIIVTATVLDEPVEPVVVATPVCESGSAIDLDWPQDVNTYTYDITRDGSLLVTGLIQSFYEDTFVIAGNSYEYVVIAHGPMGSGIATSAPVTATAIESCIPPPPIPNPEPAPEVTSSTVSILTIGSKSVSDTKEIMSLTDATPRFTGTSTISNAIIRWTVQGSVVISGQTVANQNGYWSWQIPVKLSDRRHVVFVTAIDPIDSGHSATDIENFQIRETRMEEKKKSASSDITHTSIIPQKSSEDDDLEAIPQVSPLDFSLFVDNPLNVVTQGDDLLLHVSIDFFDRERYGTAPSSIQYSVLNEKGEKLLEEVDEANLLKETLLHKRMAFPRMLDEGRYSVRADIVFDKFIVTREREFFVRELPFIHFGGGFVITYPQIVRNIGWIVGISLLLLLLWILLWIREYWFYLHAVRHITERHLMGRGFVRKRKEVRQ